MYLYHIAMYIIKLPSYYIASYINTLSQQKPERLNKSLITSPNIQNPAFCEDCLILVFETYDAYILRRYVYTILKDSVYVWNC